MSIIGKQDFSYFLDSHNDSQSDAESETMVHIDER